MKQAVVKMVQECCLYVDQTPNKETKIKLIETLRSVTEGKIYVEVERARLTHKLAKLKEDEGDVSEAAKIIQELQVETYGSMEKREKVELILEQMRLCLEIKDYIRTQIISKKISTRFFEEENTEVSFEHLVIRIFIILVDLFNYLIFLLEIERTILSPYDRSRSTKFIIPCCMQTLSCTGGIWWN